MSYNLRSRGPLPHEGSPEQEEEVVEEENASEWEEESDSESDAVEDDPFYEPYLENEQFMNIARIVRYELVRNYGEPGGDAEDEEFEEEDDVSVVNTRVVPASEADSPPPPPPSAGAAFDVAPAERSEQEFPNDPMKLNPADFEGLPRYRLAFLCVRHFEWTGIRNIAVASTIPNEALMRALCQIPRGGAVADCSICSYPLWDSLETKCCSQPLCIHCVNRCAECPYCRAKDF